MGHMNFCGRTFVVRLVVICLWLTATSHAYVAQQPCCASCTGGRSHFYALDTPNHECAETCLDTSNKLQMAEWWILTGGRGQSAKNMTKPCASEGFHRFNRTDVIGFGPVQMKLDKYIPDNTALVFEQCVTEKGVKDGLLSCASAVLGEQIKERMGAVGMEPRGPSPKSKCALKCTAEALGVYAACAAVCVKKLAPNSCITVGCPAAVTAFDVPCLKKCK